jgi:hypothetical protein
LVGRARLACRPYRVSSQNYIAKNMAFDRGGVALRLFLAPVSRAGDVLGGQFGQGSARHGWVPSNEQGPDVIHELLDLVKQFALPPSFDAGNT